MALKILPNVSAFQHPAAAAAADGYLPLHERLVSAGLWIPDESSYSPDDVICIDDDLLLIAGTVRNQVTKCVYEPPIYIDRSLSEQGLVLLDERARTKILVLPRNTTSQNLFTNATLVQHILAEQSHRDVQHIQSVRPRSRTSVHNFYYC